MLGIGGGGGSEIGPFAILIGWLALMVSITLAIWRAKRKPPTATKEQQAKERMRISGDRPGGGGGGGGAY